MEVYIVHIKRANNEEVYETYPYQCTAHFRLEELKQNDDIVGEVIETEIKDYQPLIVASIEDFKLPTEVEKSLSNEKVNEILYRVKKTYEYSVLPMDAYWDTIDCVKNEFFPNVEIKEID